VFGGKNTFDERLENCIDCNLFVFFKLRSKVNIFYEFIKLFQYLWRKYTRDEYVADCSGVT